MADPLLNIPAEQFNEFVHSANQLGDNLAARTGMPTAVNPAQQVLTILSSAQDLPTDMSQGGEHFAPLASGETAYVSGTEELLLTDIVSRQPRRVTPESARAANDLTSNTIIVCPTANERRF